MLGKYQKYLVILTILMAMACTAAAADSTSPLYASNSEASLDARPEYKGIAKVRSGSPGVTKVRPSFGFSSGFDALSRFNPVTWGPDCWLPVPAKGQFVVAPRLFFATLHGKVARGVELTGGPSQVIDFDDHLGFKKTGNTIWSIGAMYQFRPRWGLTYSFSPMVIEGTQAPLTGFTFMGQTFATGNVLHAKWERYEHRAGLFFDISRSANSMTRLYADWLHLRDRLSLGAAITGGATAVTWDNPKNMAVVGLEFEKCLKNYRGNTLALTGKGGVAFLDDNVGYEAEAALNYLIPIKTGRYGFVKGGYRYVDLKRDKTNSLFHTTMDGAFLELGFLF